MSRQLARGCVLGLLCLGIACIDIEAEYELIPCESGTRNLLDDAGECICREGFTWCDPSDPDNLSCCEDGGETTG